MSNQCKECGGMGGKVVDFSSSYLHPRIWEFVECESCLEKGVHPLDTSKPITEDEAIEWGEDILEDYDNA